LLTFGPAQGDVVIKVNGKSARVQEGDRSQTIISGWPRSCASVSASFEPFRSFAPSLVSNSFVRDAFKLLQQLGVASPVAVLNTL
jgi:hypothetical protein